MADLRPRDRRLEWDGCCNVRDLDGLPTEDGSATRFGAVVRADDVTQLSPAGWDTLVDYRVRRIVDLRHEDPPYEAPVEVARVPLVEDGTFREIDQLLEGVDDPVEWRRRNYLYFLLDAVVADYTQSEASWAPAIPAWIDAAPDGTERKKRRILSVMPPAAMRDVLAELDDEHEGARGYLARAGVKGEDLDILRERLRG